MPLQADAVAGHTDVSSAAKPLAEAEPLFNLAVSATDAAAVGLVEPGEVQEGAEAGPRDGLLVMPTFGCGARPPLGVGFWVLGLLVAD